MQLNSTGRSHELLFYRAGSVAAHHPLTDSSSHARPLTSPGLAQKLGQDLVDLKKVQEWGKD